MDIELGLELLVLGLELLGIWLGGQQLWTLDTHIYLAVSTASLDKPALGCQQLEAINLLFTYIYILYILFHKISTANVCNSLTIENTK